MDSNRLGMEISWVSPARMGDRAGGCCSLSPSVSHHGARDCLLTRGTHRSRDMGGISLLPSSQGRCSSFPPFSCHPPALPGSLSVDGLGNCIETEKCSSRHRGWGRDAVMEEFVEFCPISKVLKRVKRSRTPSWEFPTKPDWFWFSGLWRKLSTGSGGLVWKPGGELEELAPLKCQDP